MCLTTHKHKRERERELKKEVGKQTDASRRAPSTGYKLTRLDESNGARGGAIGGEKLTVYRVVS